MRKLSDAGIYENTDYSYDHENRLISVTSPNQTIVDYRYDTDGIRTATIADGVRRDFLVDKNRPYAQVLEETDDAGSLVASYVYGDDLISQDRGAVSYYLYDGQLSTRQLTDDTGTVTDTYVYDAFGSLTFQSGTTQNTYLYMGEQHDSNVGFYYLRARYYDQSVGRFTTADPFKVGVGSLIKRSLMRLLNMPGFKFSHSFFVVFYYVPNRLLLLIWIRIAKNGSGATFGHTTVVFAPAAGSTLGVAGS